MSETLTARLRADLTTAMKSRDQLRSGTLRMAIAAVQAEEVAGPVARKLGDDEVVTVLGREVRKRREAAEAFAGAGREQQAAQERAELAVLEEYLPRQLSDDELAGLVEAAVAEAAAGGATGPRAMGAVMGRLRPKVAGVAEGSRVAAAVKARLAAS